MLATMESSSPTEEVVMVDPDGDLILEIRQKRSDNDEPSESGNLKRLLVSSKILTISSPVFKARLCGPFLEGQLALSNVNPPVLPLPEDDPGAMEMLTRILHHSFTITDVLRIPGLCHMAMTSDKYGCNVVIKSWFHAYLFRRAKSGPFGASELARLLSASYMLDDHEFFYRCTEIAILEMERNQNALSLQSDRTDQSCWPNRV